MNWLSLACTHESIPLSSCIPVRPAAHCLGSPSHSPRSALDGQRVATNGPLTTPRNTMKRTLTIITALLLCLPAIVRAQTESESRACLHRSTLVRGAVAR